MELPQIGLGTAANTNQKDLLKVFKVAFKTGYKLIDTAQMYDNETQIGEALRKLKVNRESVWITSKVTPENMVRTSDSFYESLKKLQVEYIDLMLIHWPASDEENTKSYKELMALREKGLIKYIGVSNFSVDQLKALNKAVNEWPYNNQVSAAPTFFHPDVEKFCISKGITLTGYSIMKPYFKPNDWQPGSAMNDSQKEYVESLVEKYKKDAGQVLNKWALQHGYHIIPKSSKPSRVESNYDLLDFELTNAEIKKLDEMNTL